MTTAAAAEAPQAVATTTTTTTTETKTNNKQNKNKRTNKQQTKQNKQAKNKQNRWGGQSISLSTHQTRKKVDPQIINGYTPNQHNKTKKLTYQTDKPGIIKSWHNIQKRRNNGRDKQEITKQRGRDQQNQPSNKGETKQTQRQINSFSRGSIWLRLRS